MLRIPIFLAPNIAPCMWRPRMERRNSEGKAWWIRWWSFWTSTTKSGNSWRNHNSYGFLLGQLLGFQFFSFWVALNGGFHGFPTERWKTFTRSCDLFCWTCWPDGSSGVTWLRQHQWLRRRPVFLVGPFSPRNMGKFTKQTWGYHGISTRKRGWSDCRVFKRRKNVVSPCFTQEKGCYQVG